MFPDYFLLEGNFIGDQVFINCRRLVCEEGSQINAGAYIVGGGDFHLGKYSVVGYRAILITGTDMPEGAFMCDYKSEEERKVVRGYIKVGSNCFIGSGAVVSVSKRCPNLEIGDGAVIGSLSFVDESIPEGVVGWGQPFQVKRKRFEG